jgi:7,8-dihydropterin-6-yl-methyl-4-(beta-D-ribofuranosyl)aminobenzene 5'-phosphate synthase
MRLLTMAILWGAGLGLLAAASDPLEILVLYDNAPIRTDTQADWGFAALVTFRGEKVLFDSGAKPDILLSNMKALAVDPAGIRHAVISHGHGDHLLGIYRVFPFNRSMKVYFLDAFPDQAFRDAEAIGMRPQRVRTPIGIVDGVYSTGPVDGTPPEQALVIETAKGLVVLTGCSHPGVVQMVEAAERQRGAKSVRFLLGGFHMLQQSEAEATQNIERVRALGVASVSATHCTGDLPMRLFARAYGRQSATAGAGKRIVLD